MTISVLNEILVNLASNDFRVNQAYAGDVYDINTKENRFGCFVATPMTATRNEGGVITYHYVMYYIDRLTEVEDNIDLVQTDAVSVLKRVIDNLGYQGIEMGDGYQFTLFKHQFDDWCAGAYVDIDFIVPDMDCQEFEIGKTVDLRPITITENGTYLPDGFDGFSSVFVNVEGGSDVTREWVEDYVTSQGYLTEHQPLKTINHISLIGNGNIDIEGGGVTEEWVIQAIDDKTINMVTEDDLDTKLVDYATQSWIEEQGYLKTIPSEYAKKTDIPDVSGFATKDEMGDKVDEAAFDDYKSEVNTALAGKADRSELEGLASESWVEGKGYLTEHQPIKTINGESLIGEGDIVIGGDSKTQFILTPNEDMTGFVEDEQYQALLDYAKNGGDPKECEVYFYNGSSYISASSVGMSPDPDWVVELMFTIGTTALGADIYSEGQNIIITEITEDTINDQIDSKLAGYATKDEIPTIPENVSAFNNDAGYLTEHQSLDDCIKKSAIDGKWNLVVNTAGEVHPNEFYAPSTEGHGYDFVNLKTVKNFYDDTIHKADIWTGTQAQWDALTDTQKASYIIALIRA